MRRFGTAVLALSLFSTTAFAQKSTEPSQASRADKEVLVVFHRIMDAIGKNDGDALVRDLGPDYQYISFKGAVLDRAQLLATYHAGRTRADSLAISEERVRVYGDVAILTFRRYQVSRFNGDQSPADVRMTHVYARRKGRWELVSSQVTPVVA